MAADRDYRNRHVRHDLHRRGIGSVIPQPESQHPRALIDWPAHAQRNQVERPASRLEQGRRIATRYEQRAASYLAMPQTAAIMPWRQG